MRHRSSTIHTDSRPPDAPELSICAPRHHESLQLPLLTPSASCRDEAQLTARHSDSSH